MQELADKMRGQADALIEADADDGGMFPLEQTALREASERFATAALRNFTDDLLSKALAVSAAVSNFLAELELRAKN